MSCARGGVAWTFRVLDVVEGGTRETISASAPRGRGETWLCDPTRPRLAPDRPPADPLSDPLSDGVLRSPRRAPPLPDRMAPSSQLS